MKKKLFTFVTLLLCTIVIYGGSGVNTYFFCCNDCRNEGSAAIIEHKCCEIHHHHHLGELVTHYDDHTCEQHITDLPDACSVKRISVEWTLSSENRIHLQPVITDLVFSALPTDNYVCGAPPIPETEFADKPSQKPPNLSKDDYFSLLVTLII